MENNKRFEGVQHREIDLNISEVRVLDEEQRIVELSFSSETPVLRYGFYEVLSHKGGAVDLNRINTTGCLLFNHNRDRVLGKIIKASVKGRRGIAKVQFDDDNETMVIYNKVISGTLRGVSCGYVIHDYKREVEGKGETAKVTYTATKWEPIEISIVSVPADISVGVGRSMSEPQTGGRKNYVDYQMMINQNILNAKRRTKV